MKIVHVYGSVGRMHGATKWLMAFASEIKNRGHDSRIICTEFLVPEPYWLTADVVTPRGKAGQKNGDAHQRGKVARALSNYARVLALASHLPQDADVVVLHTETTLPLMPFVKLRCRVAKVVYYCYQPPREVYDLWDVVKKDIKPVVRVGLRVVIPIYKWVDKMLIRGAHCTLVWSREYREYAQEIYGALNYVLVPAGVDFRMFELADAEVATRNRLLRGDCEHLLLMNASLTRKKNVDIFIRLLASLAGEGMNVRGVVIGEGPLQSELQALAERVGVSDRFVITGYVSQEDLPYYYYAADILYYLEPNGAWTMSIIEAGAARMPVVAASGGSIFTLVKDGETGYIVTDVTDLECLHSKTVSLLRNDELRARMGQNNYRHCTQFSLGYAVDVFLESLAQLECD